MELSQRAAGMNSTSVRGSLGHVAVKHLSCSDTHCGATTCEGACYYWASVCSGGAVDQDTAAAQPAPSLAMLQSCCLYSHVCVTNLCADPWMLGAAPARPPFYTHMRPPPTYTLNSRTET